MALHRILTGHRLYANTVKEIAKLDEARRKRTAKEDARRQAHEALLRAYNAELDAAILEDREPTIKNPGPWVPSEGADRAALLFEGKRRNLEAALAKLAGRLRPELEPRIHAREAELLSIAREALEALRAAAGELEDLRETVSHLRAKAGVAPVSGPRPTVENLIQALDGGYSLVGAETADQPPRSVGFNLDRVDIGV